MAETKMNIARQNKLQMDDLLTLGRENRRLADRWLSVVLAIAPILQHYRGPLIHWGFTLLAVIAPFVLFKLFRPKRLVTKKQCLDAVLPIILFQIYRIVRSPLTYANNALALYLIALFVAMAFGIFHFRSFFLTSTALADLGAIAIMIQFFAYTFFHRHIQMIPVQYLLDERNMWTTRLVTGFKPDDTFYRPSGLFLEPSHYFLYALPVLCFMLFLPGSNAARLRRAVLISLGIFFSTSGMGLAVVVVLWGVFIIFYDKRQNETTQKAKDTLKRLFSVRTLVFVAAALLVLYVLYQHVGFMKDTVDRVLYPKMDRGTSEAIDGRVARANLFLKNMTAHEWIWGTAVLGDNLDFNFPGFHATIYRWGIVGAALTYWYYGRGLLMLKGAYFHLSWILLAVSFFSAHTHGTFYILYFAMYLMNGYLNTQSTMIFNKQSFLRYECVEASEP